MNGSFRIATIAGSEVRIHSSFLLLLGILAWYYYQQSGTGGAIWGITFFLLIFLCVLLHEFGHALAARSFGIRTPDITLLPIGGLARLERIPSSPYQEFVITIAGPAVNVAIVLLMWPLVGREISLGQLVFGDPDTNELLVGILFVNVVLIKFNLIPAFPMDGGRILRAILATQMSHPSATRVAARVGQGIAVLFVLYALYSINQGGGQFMLLFIAIFIFMGAQQELAWARIRQSVEGRRVSEVMDTRFETLLATMRLEDAKDVLVASGQEVFPVVDDEMLFFGLINRATVLEAIRDRPGDTLLQEIVRDDLPRLTPNTDSTEVLETMQRTRESVLPVVNSSGQFVGLVEFERLTEAG